MQFTGWFLELGPFGKPFRKSPAHFQEMGPPRPRQSELRILAPVNSQVTAAAAAQTHARDVGNMMGIMFGVCHDGGPGQVDTGHVTVHPLGHEIAMVLVDLMKPARSKQFPHGSIQSWGCRWTSIGEFQTLRKLPMRRFRICARWPCQRKWIQAGRNGRAGIADTTS